MITLNIILIIWGIISYIRIKKVCGNGTFNLLEAGLLDFIGFLLGSTMLLMVIITICITHLP
jgi:hypothetical protein